MKDFLSVDFLSRTVDSQPEIYQFSFMAFRFDTGEATLRLVSLNSFDLNGTKVSRTSSNLIDF